MSAANLHEASRSVAFKAAVEGEEKAFHSAVKRKTDPVTKVAVQVKAALSETRRVMYPNRDESNDKHKLMTREQLRKSLYARYRKRGLTKSQASARAKALAKANAHRQEKAYFNRKILEYAAKSRVKPIAPVSPRFARRAKVVEMSSALVRVAQQARARGKKLHLSKTKLAAYVHAAIQRASAQIKQKVRSEQAQRVATQQAARLGVREKIASINIPTAAEKLPPKKPKALTMQQQIKKVVNVAATLKSQSALLVKQNAALQAQVSKLSNKVKTVPALSSQVATLRARLAKNHAAAATKPAAVPAAALQATATTAAVDIPTVQAEQRVAEAQPPQQEQATRGQPATAGPTWDEAMGEAMGEGIREKNALAEMRKEDAEEAQQR
jgi:hypothetical protein